MQKIECLKLGRGLLLVAMGAVLFACSQGVDANTADEKVGKTSAAVSENDVYSLFCNDCFEETNNGGGGSGGGLNQGGPGSAGSGGFVTSGVDGVGGVMRGAPDEDCPPDVDCVNVKGLPRVTVLTPGGIPIYVGWDIGDIKSSDGPSRTGKDVPKFCSKGSKGKDGVEQQCPDNDAWLRDCLAASMNRPDWLEFVDKVRWANTPEAAVDSAILRRGYYLSARIKRALCYAVFLD